MRKEASGMTEQEKKIVKLLNHPTYTVEYLEEWTNRNDNVFANAPAALAAMGANGFMLAVSAMAKCKDIKIIENDMIP